MGPTRFSWILAWLRKIGSTACIVVIISAAAFALSGTCFISERIWSWYVRGPTSGFTEISRKPRIFPLTDSTRIAAGPRLPPLIVEQDREFRVVQVTLPL